MKNYLIALQTPYDEIKYITNHDDNYSYLQYYDFFSKMNSVYIEKPAEFRRCLDEIGRIVVLDLDTGKWEKQPIAANVEHTMNELIEYNEQFRESEEKKDKVSMYKEFIKLFVRKKK